MSNYIFEKTESVRLNARKKNIYDVYEEIDGAYVFAGSVSGSSKEQAEYNYFNKDSYDEGPNHDNEIVPLI